MKKLFAVTVVLLLVLSSTVPAMYPSTQEASAEALRQLQAVPTAFTAATPVLPGSEPPGPLAPLPTPTPFPRPQTWIAGETSVSRLSENDRRQRLGVPLEVLEWERLQASRASARTGVLYSYPSTKDWRSIDGQDWTTAIRDQGNCGSCVAFGTVGAIESRLEIVHNNPGLSPDLSEAHLFFCNGRRCDTGWWPSAAMNYARDTGITDEACYPYADYDQPCNLCSNWQSRVRKITRWTGTSNVAAMKQALADKGPFEATMTVYTDFFYYLEGIYRYTWGEEEGGHAITIVGYDDNGGYWIAKNSWGTEWGEGGWFRIAYGECGIDDYAYIPCLLFGDLDGDKDVDVDDIQAVANRWRQRSGDPGWEARFDVNGDGVINIVDIMKVAAHWGETCE